MLLLLLACAPEPAPSAAPVATPAPAVAPATAPKVVFLGDSLTAGAGLPLDQAWPAVLGASLRAAGHPITVVNAGVSGDTTADGLARLDWLLSQKPAVIIVCLGANDMLRGMPPADAEHNLRAIVQRAQAAGVKVAMAGMRANPTLGPEYVAAFEAIYPRLAAELDVPLLPVLREVVAGDPALTQADGLHPTAAGQAKIAALMRPVVEPLVVAR